MIKRTLLPILQNHLSQKEITLIVGPRQAGKTTLMFLLKNDLESKGEKTLFFNLDIEADRQFFTSQEQLRRKIFLEVGSSHAYIFIDEIQRKEDAGLFLKGLYDMNLPYKFIVSGSGSLELKEHIHESLAGRKEMFELTILTFSEFVDYKTEYRYAGNLPEFFALDRVRGRSLFEEYLNFGGYPRVILEETADRKRKIIAELYQSYLEKDVSYLLGVQKTEDFTNLVKVMSSQIGCLVNISELSSRLGISMPTVKNYLWYLQKTFLIAKVTPFFHNIRKEITKTPVYYFGDLGMRNYALGRFGGLSLRDEIGHLFENFIFQILRGKTENSATRIHFWRTKDKAEVDFVLSSGSETVPVEVKYQKLKKTEMTRSFQNYLSAYHPRKAYLVHLGEKNQNEIKETTVYSMSYDKFLFEKIFT